MNNKQSNTLANELDKPTFVPLTYALEEFLDRNKSEFKLAPYKDYEHTIIILRYYIDTFGSVLMKVKQPVSVVLTKSSGIQTTCDMYQASDLAHLFRGLVLFFLNYKVNASHEFKKAATKITEEFIEWLISKKYLPLNFRQQFLEFDTSTVVGAMQAAAVLKRFVANAKKNRKGLENIRDSEPLYMVSRVKSGKLWFIYCAGEQYQYDEFGPVSVPLGVSDLVKSGWLLECAFSMYNGRWHITKTGDVLPA